MPPVIRGNWSGIVSDQNFLFKDRDLEYKYPYNMDLRPGRPLHDRIVARVLERAQDSYDVMSKRYPTWNSMDEVLTAYIPLSDYEKALKKQDRNKPVSIVVPHSYAALETILAYCTKAFLTNQIFQYEGVGPEDSIGAKLLELVVAQQVHRFKAALDMHTGFRDGLSYGFHVSSVGWEERWGMKPIIRSTPQFTSLGNPLPPKLVRDSERTLLFEGGKVNAIDPYKTLPDPNVSIHKIQEGEFFGWVERSSLNKLLGKDLSGELFNVKYLQTREAYGGNITSSFLTERSKREKEGTSKGVTRTTKDVILVPMYITLIPREWGLPGHEEYNKDGYYPEKWTFMVANDTILLMCDRLGLNHDMYPIAVNSPDYDGYSIAPVSRMEINYGLQEVLSWTFNSHIANVRKAIHDMFVVDPSLISMTDLENPSPGKYLRLRRSAWGRGVKDAIAQLNVNDVTRGNINDAAFIMDMMQKAWATPDAGMGFMRGGSERRSAAEFSGTFGAHISRLEHLARITSLQYMYDLAYMFASHTQQLISQETFVKAIGEWPTVLIDEYGIDVLSQGSLKVDPLQLLVDFDIICKDSSDTHVDANSLNFWNTVLPVLLGNPMLFGVFDITRIFKRIARLSGEKNVGDFIMKGGMMQAQLISNELLLAEKQKGNVVPVNGEEAE